MATTIIAKKIFNNVPRNRRDFLGFLFFSLSILDSAKLSFSCPGFCLSKSCSAVDDTGTTGTLGNVLVFSVSSKTSLRSRLRL